MEKDGCQLYAGAKVINCEVRQKIIVGEDSFVSGGKLEDYVQINRRNMIVDSVIGTCTYTGMNTVIKQAQIGKYCSISWNVSITGNKHDYKRISPHPFPLLKSFEFVEANTPLDYSKVSIGNDVWIGMNACILPGVIVGDGAVIGAGSVVTKDVPAYAIVAGNSAKVIKYRFSKEIIDVLLSSQWWDWPREVISHNLDLFNGEIDGNSCKRILEITEKMKIATSCS